jgi:hypothetical protein
MHFSFGIPMVFVHLCIRLEYMTNGAMQEIFECLKKSAPKDLSMFRSLMARGLRPPQDFT